MRDPNGINDTEWAARGAKAISKPKVLRNLTPAESRLPDLSGVNLDVPTEKPIAQSVKAVMQSSPSASPAGPFNFSGGQSVRAYNTKNARYQLGKILQKTVGSATHRDEITKNVLGNITSGGKLYRKDVVRSLRSSGLASSQVNRIMGHLGM